jgi:uncharacterized protein YbjT (DUF2867 family)
MNGSPMGRVAQRRVAIAGADGFVGRALAHALARSHSVVGLVGETRARKAVTRLEWRVVDLFNLRETENALVGVDVAVYVIQSVPPPAHLTQGESSDLDLICADNFARAAARSGVGHIAYLGCLLPKTNRRGLSSYFESRLEIERTLGSHGVPLTTLRAGIILGPDGMGFETLVRLGRRPLLLCPRWIRSLSQAIARADVVALLEFALGRPDLAGRAYDIAGPNVASYAELLRMTGEALGRRPRILTLPFRAAKLSTLWLSATLSEPLSRVRPMVEAFQQDLVPTDGLVFQQEAALAPLPLRDAIARAVEDETALPRRGRAPTEPRAPSNRRVCSVQRLRIRSGRSAAWVAEEYVRWLPRFFRQILRVSVDEARTVCFFLWPLRRPLLILSFATDRSSPDRQLFFVTGGVLSRVSSEGRPRLEFRTVLDGTIVLAAIQDFWPRLPWFIYELTQALVHLLVMRAFARHLGRDDRAPADACPGAAG